MLRARSIACLLLSTVAAALCAQTFRERVDVDLVRVEILALDGKGQPVRGLKPSDFTVLVDGRPVKVESFEEGARTESSPLQPLPDGAALTSPSLSEAAPAAAQAPGRYFLAVLVDETSSEQSNRQVALGQLFEFLKTGLPSDVEVLLMRFGGTLRIECPWTSDVERLRRAVTALAQHRAASLLGVPGQLSGNPEKGQTVLQLEALDAMSHVRSSLHAIFDALRVFPETPGRKSLFVVTDGAPFLTPTEIARDLIKSSNSGITANDGPDAARRAQLEADRDTYLLADSLAWDKTRSVSLLADITRLALARGVAIHPVVSTAHDLDGRVRADRSFNLNATAQGSRPLVRGSSRGGNSVPTTDIASGQGMEEMAEITGGEAVLSRRAIREGLKREVDGRNAAYAIAFPDPFAGDHKFHKIEIKAARRGLDLRYRRGYRVLARRESLIQATVNRLYVPADQNDLGARLDIQSLGMENGRASAQITIAYPAPPEAGGKTNTGGAVQIIGTCAVRDGKISEPIDMSGQTEATSQDDRTWLARTGRVSLLPGAYRFSFAIRDEPTGITSYLTFDRRLP